jgi:hypothetical protein
MINGESRFTSNKKVALFYGPMLWSKGDNSVIMTRLELERTLLSNSESSSASIVPRFSCGNVLRSRSLSSVPRLRLWYTRRARVVSMDAPGHSSGGLRGGDVIEAICSGVWGIDQGSFHLTDDEDWCHGEEDPWT